MDSYHITGGTKLSGDYRLKGAKNDVLPILAATILTGDTCVISGCPHLSDVHTMVEILRALGCCVTWEEDNITVDSKTADRWDIPEHLMKQMRSSVFLMGPLLARFGRVSVGQPGGCAIGKRPVDIHLSGLRRLGARVDEGEDCIVCSREASGLSGTVIRMEFPSVGATENLMMAACLAEGETRIIHPAREPEIEDLQNFLNSCGACINGAGTGEIIIEGVSQLHGCSHRLIPDRIEAGTMLAAAAITGGELRLFDSAPNQMAQTLSKLQTMGCRIKVEQSTIHLWAPQRLRAVKEIKTLPYPGFPTDMQAQFLSLLAVAKGDSRMTETIFESRFNHARQLQRMGADVSVEGQSAYIRGVAGLSGACVPAEDLRGGAALVLAGLAAEGETIVENICHIDRGYDKLEVALQQLGAKMERIKHI